MDIMEAIEKRANVLVQQGHAANTVDALAAIFKADRSLYEAYRRASSHPQAHPEEETPAAKAEAPTAKAAGEGPIPLALQVELMKCAELADPAKPLSRGMEKVRQALRTARLAS
jgi:hypothetical protein